MFMSVCLLVFCVFNIVKTGSGGDVVPDIPMMPLPTIFPSVKPNSVPGFPKLPKSPDLFEHIRDAVFTDGNSAFALLIGTLRTFQRAGCDNEVVTLRCPPGTSIAIQVAQYGKSTSTEGPCAKMMSTKSSLFPEIYDKKVCLLPSSIQYALLQTVIEACQKKRMCKFQTSPITFGGDPCPGIPKYVEVAYKCKPYEFRSKTVCENERIQLKCNPNQRVAIYSASYGRTQYESVQCPQAPGVPEETCLASYATETAMQLCHGKRRCEMAADIGTFGSPCRPQSRTYLKLVYTCVPRIVLKDTYDGPPEPDELDYNPHEYLDFENFENYDNENEHMGESAASPGSKADSKEVLHENATEEDDPTTELPNVFWFEIHQLHIIYAGIGITIITFVMVSALVIRYLYKRHQRTKDNSNSYAASGSENTLPHGFTDEISEVDADIDLQTTLPLSIPSVTIHRPLPPCLPNIGPSISDAVRFAEYPEFPRLPSHTRTFRGSASGILETEVVATRPIMCDASTSHTSQYYYG
ncbi:uncharacterized protein LOC126749218 [Anthonomus grandis grandis]|uniref:uncharacterized protein LOC126749218 n=1 Tax=Anthonomus grandis grandis TaxID=2921223 RepID=UPI0021651DA6|nr:uncharacterized protein LOC126749218 [Anthonomus grandis grandis]